MPANISITLTVVIQTSIASSNPNLWEPNPLLIALPQLSKVGGGGVVVSIAVPSDFSTRG